MKDFGYVLIAYQRLSPVGWKIPRRRMSDDRNALFMVRVSPDKGGRSKREHWLAMLSADIMLALQSRGREEQLAHWRGVLHEVEGIVSYLSDPDSE